MKRYLVISIALFFLVSGCSGSLKKEGGAKEETRKADRSIDADKKVLGSSDHMPAAKSPSEDKRIKKKKNGGGEKASELGFKDSASVHKTSKSRGFTAKAPAVSGLKAGFADDNRQFNYFTNFLEQYGQKVNHYLLNIKERIFIRVIDSNGKSIANADIEVYDRRNLLVSGRTYADGSFLFFPAEYGQSAKKYRAKVYSGNQTKEIEFDRQGNRVVEVKLPVPRHNPQQIPLDIVFIMDTTGSMGEEISRLKNTIEIINMNLSSISIKPKLRFGMVLYKDVDDVYVTKVIPLTSSLDDFIKRLQEVEASGGGDGPEDLQSALSDSIKKIQWNSNGIRLSFIITDAPPHLDYGQKYTYAHAARDAQKMGIKFFSVGTGGLDLMGEYVLRQIAQYTYAKYIFLTYGEKGESEGGKEGSVSHHTGSNFQTDKLESIIIRFAKEELAHLTDQKLDMGESYIQATKIDDEKNEETLQKLFAMSVDQLIDYSSISIEKKTPATLIPFNPSMPGLKANAEYFTEQMSFSLNKNKTFMIVERKELQKVLKELELQYSGLMKDENAVKVGKLIGAKMMIGGTLYERKDTYEIFLKLLRVETGEILSVNKLKIDRKLGIE